MKLVTFQRSVGGDRVGALIEGDTAVVELKTAAARPDRVLNSMQALIEAGPDALDYVRGLITDPPGHAVLARDDVRLRAPLPRPLQIRDCLCFEAHLKGAYDVLRRKRAETESDPNAALARFKEQGMFEIPEIWYRQPIYYKANPLTVIGTDEDVVWPSYAEVLDYELEFGIVIGKAGKDISKGVAGQHIFGYAIYNDISARDAQAVEMPGLLGPGKGKDFDTGNVIGPCIVTADEIDAYDLTMVARINGDEWSRGLSRTMHWKFEDLIAHFSRSETLYPGEFIASGTVGGGCGLELDRYLSPGDVVELEIDGIGVLRNRIVREQ